MARKKPVTQYDVALGARIREARHAQKLSQGDLADMIGTSYQQIQKYERGRNRVPAAHIDRLVTALNRPVTYFFPNATDVRASADPMVTRFIISKDGYRVATAWFRVHPKARGILLELVEQLAKGT